MNNSPALMSRDSSHFQHEQQARLAEIGAYLRDVREESLLSLEDVADRTHIQARLLRAIESGEMQRLPEPVYIQGFLKRYANALDLDGMQVAEAFPTEAGVAHEPPSWKDSPAAQLRPLHLYLAYVALIMVAVGMLSHVVNRSTPQGNTQINSDNRVQPSVAVQSSPAASAQASGDRPSPKAQTKPVQVEAKLTAQSWMRIVSDGKTLYEGVLPEGSEETWTADKEIIVRAGNAGGVMLAHNGGKSELMGEPGAVEELTFTVAQESASLPTANRPPTQ